MARIGDAEITRSQFEEELKRRAEQGLAAATSGDREAILRDLIRTETLFQRAKEKGLDRDPELNRQFKRMVAAKYEDAERKGRATVARPDGSEVDLYYQSHQDEFTTPEKVRVAVLFVQVPRKAGSEEQAKARQRAEELRIQAVAASGEQPHFGLLAQTHSDDQTTRYRGGDCGWITRENLKQRWDAQVVAAIVELQKPGEISPVVRAADGYYLAKLIQRKAALTAPLKAVRERIEKKLMDAAQKRERERFEQDQRAGLKIEINEALLKSIEAPARSSRGGEVAPPPMPFQ